MAKHPRQLIREAAVTALRFKTQAQDRVFSMRVDPYGLRELPAVSLYTLSEDAQPANIDGDSDRTLTLDVKAVALVETGKDVGETLDAMALEIEAALAADTTLGGTAIGSELTGTALEFAEEGRDLLAAATLSFRVNYTAAAPA